MTRSTLWWVAWAALAIPTLAIVAGVVMDALARRASARRWRSRTDRRMEREEPYRGRWWER